MEHVGWVFTLMAIIGTIINAKGNRACFYIWIVSNMGFVVINVMSENYSQAALFAFNLSMYGVGLRCWKTKEVSL